MNTDAMRPNKADVVKKYRQEAIPRVSAVGWDTITVGDGEMLD